MSDELLDDLAAEQHALGLVLDGLGLAQWDAPTPAAGWAVRDQVAHLAFGEELAALACTDEGAFGERLLALLSDLDAVLRDSADRALASAPTLLLSDWRAASGATLAALRARDPEARVPWITGPMSIRSFATARLMETWAHGHDIADGLGRAVPVTARLRHVAHIGVSTRAFAYRNRGLEPPANDVHVVLDEGWSWGPEDALDQVRGPALDFCQVVTQRRPVADTALTATGPHAREWLEIAQCFAGPPTTTTRTLSG